MTWALCITPDARSPEDIEETECYDKDLATVFSPQAGPKDGVAFVPVQLRPGGKRCAADVRTVTALVVDVDHVTPEVGGRIIAALQTAPHQAVVYETYSHTEAAWCFRIIYPFSTPYSVESPAAWKRDRAALLKHLGLAADADPACADPARLYFFGRYPAGQRRDVLYRAGAPLNWRAVLEGVTARDTVTTSAVMGVQGGGVPVIAGVEQIRARLEVVARGTRPAAPVVASLLAGRALAAHGHRHRAWLQATGVLADVLHGLSLGEHAEEVLHALGAASRDAEMAATPDAPHEWASLEHMLESALATAGTRAAAQERELSLLRRMVSAAAPAPGAPPSAGDEDNLIEQLLSGLSVTEREKLLACFRDPTDTSQWPTLFPEAMAGAALYLMHLAGWRLLRGTADVSAVRFAENNQGEMALDQMSLSGLRTWLAPHKVQIGKERKSLAQFWVESINTPRYEGLVTTSGNPGRGFLNLWQGLATTPKAGDATPMRELIKSLAGHQEDPVAVDYLWRWCAWAVQHPTERSEVAVVLKGPEGCGKGTLARTMRALFGAHGTQIHRRDDLVGRFNSALLGKGLVVADECVIVRDAEMDTLKSIITEERITTEGKFRDQLQCDNILKLMILTNHEHAVLVGEARRFVVYEADHVHSWDTAEGRSYWAELNRWLDNGGREAFLHALLTTDLAGWHPRDRPATRGLKNERAASLSGVQGWLHQMLSAGELPGSTGLPVPLDRPIAAGLLLDDAVKWCRARGNGPAPSSTSLGRALRAIGVTRKLSGPKRLASWEFSLLAARHAFANWVKVDMQTLGFEETACNT